jgi:hypothetical protein
MAEPSRYGYGPDPSTVEPYPGAPRFFVRAWDTRLAGISGARFDEATGKLVLEDFEPLMPGGGILAIWGFAARSPYAEDLPQERFAFDQRRSFCAWCYSEMEPNGELGFVPLDEIVEVGRDEFEKALDALRPGTRRPQ